MAYTCVVMGWYSKSVPVKAEISTLASNMCSQGVGNNTASPLNIFTSVHFFQQNIHTHCGPSLIHSVKCRLGHEKCGGSI